MQQSSASLSGVLDLGFDFGEPRHLVMKFPAASISAIESMQGA